MTAIVLFRKLVYLKVLKQLRSLLRVLFVLKNLMTDWHLFVLLKQETPGWAVSLFRLQ